MNRRKVSMKDIALACDTTVPTVSYALSGSRSRYIKAELRERILQCAGEMGYVAQHPDRSLRTIGVVLPQIENVFFRRMITGVEKVANKKGFIPVFYNTGDLPEREEQILTLLTSSSICGCLLVASERSSINESLLASWKFPYVVAERPLPCDGEYDFVSMDNFDAGYVATNALIQAGHRNIGLISWKTSAITLLDRHVGYARALEEAHILYRPEYVVNGVFSEEAGYQMTRELLENQPDISALVFAYHVQGQGGVRYLHENGIQIPQQLSVVVIGDPSWVEMMVPPCTHVSLPSVEVASVAADRLISRINGDAKPNKERIVLKGSLVRGSTIRQL